MQIADHIVFFLLGGLLPLLLWTSARKRAREEAVSPTGGHWPEGLKIRLYYGNGLLLCGLAAMVLTVWYFGGRSFTEIGLGWGEMPYDPSAIFLLLAFLVLYPLDLYLEIGNPERRRETRLTFRKLGFLPANGTQFLHFLFLAVCAGVCEEIVYRGFMIVYLENVLGTDPWALVVVLLFPALAFGVGHLYQGWQAVGKIIAMAVLFGFFFLRTGTLWPLMLLHTAVDVVGGLISWYVESEG